jgi:poly(A) polymerase
MDRIDPDAEKVLKRLTRAGFTAYLVGGGVRDLLLGRTPKDFDIATSARPNDVRSLFRNCRIIGRRFRLAHILFAGGKIIEVATFRKDPTAPELLEPIVDEELELEGEMLDISDTDADLEMPIALVPARKDRGDGADLLIRHDNVFGEPHEDAIRRDFTLNALFYDIDREEVIDYCGGWPDLEKRVLRTIGEPDVRFREDPIRILRAIKFSARCDLGLSPEVYDAMVGLREEVRKSAPPRVLEEVLRLLRGGASQRSMWLMWDSGVLAVVLPELVAHLEDEAEGSQVLWGRLQAIDERVAEVGTPSDTVLLGALLLGPCEEAIDGARDVGAAFERFIDQISIRLAIPRRMKDRLRMVLMSQKRLSQGRYQNLTHRDFFSDAAMLYACECHARGKTPPEWAVSPPENQGSFEDGPRRPRRRRRRFG